MAPGNREQLQEELKRIIARYGPTDVTNVVAELVSKPGKHTKCSFCGRGAAQIATLVSGSGVFICSHCIDLFYKVSHEAR